jgi:hypothetical protein
MCLSPRLTEWPATSIVMSPICRLERLDHVVVRARLQAQHHVHGVALGRQHDDRHARLGPDLPAHVDAVRPREHQVEQHEVGPGLPERLERLVAVVHERRLEAFTAQHDAEHLCERQVVVDDQYTSSHAPHRPVLSEAVIASRARLPTFYRCRVL